MKKYTQDIIFNINTEIKLHFNSFLDKYLIEGSEIIPDDQLILDYKKDNKLILKEAIGTCTWNSSGPKKYYFIGGNNITPLVDKYGIEIIMTDKIKVEEL